MPSSPAAHSWLSPQSDRIFRGRLAALLSFALIVTAIAVTYHGALRVPFLFDDFPAIVRNESIRDLSSPQVFHPPITAAGAAGRPVVNATLAADFAERGLEPRAFHLTNLLLHAAVACTLWALTRGVLRSRGWTPVRAAGTALLFSLAWAVHPLLSESVVCIIQRNEILVALFALLTVYFLWRSHLSARNRLWLAAGAVSALLGAGSKEVAVAILPIALLFDRTFVAGSFRGAWLARRGFYLALLGSWVLVGWLVLQNRERAGTVGFGLGVGSWEYALTQCRAIGTYLKLVVWPHPLVVDYGVPVVRHLGDVWPLALGLLVALTATAYALVRAPVVGFIAATFFLLLAPSSSVVPLTTQTIAEHRMYLPAAAVLALIGWLLNAVGRRLLVVGAPAIVMLCLMTSNRVAVYRDEIELWTSTVAEAPANPRAQASLAGAYLRRERWADAISSYRKAIAIKPDYADAQSDLAFVLTKTGNRAEALAHYEIAARLKPTDADIRYNLGNAYGADGRYDDAAQQFTQAIELRPTFGAAENNLGDVLLRAGRYEPAVKHLRRALQLAPVDPAVRRNLVSALAKTGRITEAIEQLRVLAERAPGSAEAHNDLGLMLVEAKDRESALREFEKALQLKPDFTGAHINAANVLLADGQLGPAATHLQQAVRLAPDNAQLRYNLGAVLAELGRRAEAETQIAEAVRLDPGFDLAREALARLRGR